MPSTSTGHGSHMPRVCKERTGGHSSKDGQRRKSSGSGKHKTSNFKIGSKDRAHGKGTTSSFSAGFRIASTTPHVAKIAKKEITRKENSPKTPGKGEGADIGHGCDNKTGDVTVVTSVRTRGNVRAQRVSKIPKKRQTPGSSPTNYKRFGCSSQMEPRSTASSPNPYLQLQNLATLEIINKASECIAVRPRSGLANQNLPTPSPRSSPTAKQDVGLDAPPSRNLDKDGNTLETAFNRRSQSSCSNGSERGCKTVARDATNRPASARRPGVSSSDGGDGCGGTGGTPRAADRRAHSPNLSSSNRKKPAPAARDDRQNRTRFSTAPPEQEDDDDEDDETGMPQAVRLPETKTGEPATSQDIVKRLHKNEMEKIARSVRPSQLMKHLSDAGYFRHDYSGSARTSTDNHNLRYGMKKGVERLYLWLSMYSPPDVNTSTSKT
ncbi:hypothetical protein EGW08_013656 [Elysia chlorotica]|uniref:Uncharacterized protein n=1 Tax=Elysia chlorotica TaxID=188477 RepID=A0A433TAJ7_ELYCH|nr:hypothetical protein EGW08_013656 [Elysia chlorotica]